MTLTQIELAAQKKHCEKYGLSEEQGVAAFNSGCIILVGDEAFSGLAVHKREGGQTGDGTAWKKAITDIFKTRLERKRGGNPIEARIGGNAFEPESGRKVVYDTSNAPYGFVTAPGEFVDAIKAAKLAEEGADTITAYTEDTVVLDETTLQAAGFDEQTARRFGGNFINIPPVKQSEIVQAINNRDGAFSPIDNLEQSIRSFAESRGLPIRRIEIDPAANEILAKRAGAKLKKSDIGFSSIQTVLNPLQTKLIRALGKPEIPPGLQIENGVLRIKPEYLQQ